MKASYIAAIVIVIVLVVGAVALSGAMSPSTSSKSTQSSTTASPSISGTSASSTLTGTSSASTSSSTSSASHTLSTVGASGSQGTFSMLATDPPITASGVSKVYLQFSGEDVHTATSAAASGWVGLNSSGTIELTSLVNTTQTIASGTIKSSAYDMARLDVTSATVLYNGKNYTANVPSDQLTANMDSQAQVNSSTASAAVIDLHTVVMNAGNTTQPQFLFSASAKATVVPSSDLSVSLTIGAKTDFHTQPWWNSFILQSTASIQITSANVTSNSLSLIVKNSGGANTTLRLVTITPVSVAAGATILPPTLTGSATFLINQDGTLSSSTQASLQSIVQGPGLNVAAGSSTTLAYTGTIQLGKSGLLTITGLLQGQQYLVTVVSTDSAASLLVVAG
jgi:trimeric autotransporter adhesin